MTEILIVDDLEANRRILRLLLEHGGYQVAEADSKPSALRLLEQSVAPALVIFDLHLGGESGVDLLRQVRADPIFRPMPVVFASALPDREAVISAAGLGVAEFLSKPIDSVRLRDVVNRTTARSWLGAHFVTPSEILVQKGIDMATYRKLTGWFFVELEKLVAARTAPGASSAALEQVAANFGLKIFVPAFAAWKAAGFVAPLPDVLQRSAVVQRLFNTFVEG